MANTTQHKTAATAMPSADPEAEALKALANANSDPKADSVARIFGDEEIQLASDGDAPAAPPAHAQKLAAKRTAVQTGIEPEKIIAFIKAQLGDRIKDGVVEYKSYYPAQERMGYAFTVIDKSKALNLSSLGISKKLVDKDRRPVDLKTIKVNHVAEDAAVFIPQAIAELGYASQAQGAGRGGS